MTYFLILFVLVFSIGIMVFASPLILYVAPLFALAILVSLATDYARDRSKMAAASDRRMTAMLEHEGIDPAFARSGDNVAIMKQTRQRCRNCTSRQTCERWLAGGEVGDNLFCPNAYVFASLKRTVRAAA